MMRKFITGIIMGTSALALAGCTPAQQAPAPTVTVTTTVTATPPALPPLAQLHYTPGSKDTSVTFVAPAEGYILVANCNGTGGDSVNYTQSSPDKANYGGTDYITCDGKQTVDVESASDLDFFDLGGKTLTLTFPANELAKVTTLDLSIRTLDL